MKPRNTLATLKTRQGHPLDLVEHDNRYFLESDGIQLAASHLARPAVELTEALCQPFRPARQPRVIFLGLGLGHALETALQALPQKGASFVVFPEAVDLPETLAKHLPHVNFADDRITFEKETPFFPLPDALSDSQAIIVDHDALQKIAPRTWKLASNNVLNNLSGMLKNGALLGILIDRPDPQMAKLIQKAGFDIVRELVPVSEKGKKKRVMYLARKGHYQRRH